MTIGILYIEAVITSSGGFNPSAARFSPWRPGSCCHVQPGTVRRHSGVGSGHCTVRPQASDNLAGLEVITFPVTDTWE